jgi:uncharacterized membrane-anchored protein
VNFSRESKFILAVAIQVAIILSIILINFAVLSRGASILLRIQYDISNLSYATPVESGLAEGETIYLILRKDYKFWSVRSAQKVRPAGDQIFVKGKVASQGSGSYHIVYGIEQYFIPEGKGSHLWKRSDEAFAWVAVDDQGNAVLKKIFVNDIAWP